MKENSNVAINPLKKITITVLQVMRPNSSLRKREFPLPERDTRPEVI